MANLKEIRIRITSVKSTQQITSAMKMVSAAKFRKAQMAILNLRPYANKLHQIFSDLSLSLEHTPDNIYSEVRDVKKVLMVVVTSNKGLCGAFNSNILKITNKTIEEQYKKELEEGNLYFITIGRKATEYFKKKKYNVVDSFDSVFDKLVFENVSPVAEHIMKLYADKSYDKVVLIYNQFKNAAMQIQTVDQFLPVISANKNVTSKEKNKIPDYIFEPDKETILQELIPKNLKTHFYRALLDSYAAEHGARMTAMHMATDNAGVLIKELQLNYNKARQATITNEILEIVSGAEALKG